jgi:hypothetical protein
MIPGQNLLNMAFRIIAQTPVIYYHFLGRTQNSVGQDVSQYAVGKTMNGSFQPVPRALYQQYGLDFLRDYWMFYTSNNILDVQRGVAGDQIGFNGQRYQLEADNDWYDMDGWKGGIFIHVGVDTGDQTLFGYNVKPSENSYLNFDNSNFVGGDT